MSRADLSGRWSGFYSYPEARPAVPFEAELVESGGRITGTTREPSHRGTLQAVLDGHRSGRTVSFLKMYEAADEAYDSVAYEGVVSEDGNEIAGRWRLTAGYSGTFIMVREAGAEEAAELEASETA